MKTINVHMELYLRLRGTNAHKRSVGLLLGRWHNEHVYVHRMVPLFSENGFREYLINNKELLKSIVGYGISQNEYDRSITLIRRIHLLNTIIYPFLVEKVGRESNILSFFRRLIVLRTLNSNEFKSVSSDSPETRITLKTVTRAYKLNVRVGYVGGPLVEDFGMIREEDRAGLFTEVVPERKANTFNYPTLRIVSFLNTKDDVKLNVIHGQLARYRDCKKDFYRADPKAIMKDEDYETGKPEAKNVEEYMQEQVRKSHEIFSNLENVINREIRCNENVVSEYKNKYDENLSHQRYLEYLSNISRTRKSVRSKTPPPPPTSNTSTPKAAAKGPKSRPSSRKIVRARKSGSPANPPSEVILIDD